MLIHRLKVFVRSQRGVALPMALLTMLILSALIVAFTMMGASEPVLANNQLQVKVDAIDETQLMVGVQKVANRITMGLLLAALIIGAAMLMQVETNFRLFGYPGLAMICFLIAAGLGFWLVVSTLLHDRPHPQHRQRQP